MGAPICPRSSLWSIVVVGGRVFRFSDRVLGNPTLVSKVELTAPKMCFLFFVISPRLCFYFRACFVRAGGAGCLVVQKGRLLE